MNAPPLVLEEVEETSVEHAREVFAQRVELELGLSAEDFLSKLDQGEYEGSHEAAVRRILVLLPLVR